MIDGSENWLLNFRIHMFVKSAVILFGIVNAMDSFSGLIHHSVACLKWGRDSWPHVQTNR